MKKSNAFHLIVIFLIGYILFSFSKEQGSVSSGGHQFNDFYGGKTFSG